MKAYVLHGIDDLRYEEAAHPECLPGWAIVKVKSAGICSSDIARIYQKGTYHFPLIPGHEFSGLVDAVGDKRDSDWLGKRVSVFPLIPCQRCEQCQSGQYEMCRNYDYIGSRRNGAFAEYVAVPIWNLLELPEEISYPEGTLLEPLAVALHAVKRAGDIIGKSVSVVGSGMIGIAAACWALKRGAAAVRIVGRSEEKRCLIECLDGIEYIYDEDKEERDVVIEAVGSRESVGRAIHLAAPGSTIVLIGNPAGDILLRQDDYWRILRNQIHVTGSWNSTYGIAGESDWTESISSIIKGDIPADRLITHKLKQDDLFDGLKIMSGHQEPYCKVMVNWNEEK